MAFGKKKKAVETQQPTERNVKVNKKKDGMALFFHENVFERVLDDFKANSMFIIRTDDETLYGGLLLNTEKIGGFNKKSNRDEAKGSIIECVNSGEIRALITQELMDEESIVFIPDPLSLSAMEGFGLLLNAEYEIVLVKEDGELIRTGVPTVWLDAHNIVQQEMLFADFLQASDYEISVVNEEETLVSDDEAYTEEVYAEEEESLYEDAESERLLASNVSQFVQPVQENELPFDDFEEEPQLDESYEEVESYEEPIETLESEIEEPIETLESEIEDSPSLEEEVPMQEELEITAEQVRETVIRRFYSDDLGLEVSSEPFDLQFLHQNECILFQENRSSGFLNDYLNEFSKDANVQLRKMYQDHLFLVRNRYFKLLSMHCEQIYSKLDLTRDGSIYYDVSQGVQHTYTEKKMNIDEVVSKEKDRLNRLFDEKLDRVGEDAARAAKQQYRDRYGKQHETELYQIESNVRMEIESDYRSDLQKVNDLRKQEAGKLLDCYINEVLHEISDMYLGLKEEELKLYNSLHDQMQTYLDENRKDEIARANALAEELARKNAVTEKTFEFEKRIRDLNDAFDSKQMALESQVIAVRTEAEQLLKEKDSYYTTKMSEFKAHENELQTRIDQLLQQFENLDHQKSKEYQSRINELTNECKSWEDRCNHNDALHKKMNHISTVLVVAGMIAFLAIGGVIGSFVSMNYLHPTVEQSDK